MADTGRPGSDQISVSKNYSEIEKRSDQIPAHSPRLFSPPPVVTATPAEARFVAVTSYWSGDSVDEGARWRTTPAEDLGWFRRVVTDHPGIDALAALNGWDDWLRRSYASWLKGRDKKSFVSDWRRSLRTAFSRHSTPPPPPAEKPDATHRRGSWAGTAQSFELPVVTPDDSHISGWEESRDT